jgi:hypothetical protein
LPKFHRFRGVISLKIEHFQRLMYFAVRFYGTISQKLNMLKNKDYLINYEDKRDLMHVLFLAYRNTFFSIPRTVRRLWRTFLYSRKFHLSRKSWHFPEWEQIHNLRELHQSGIRKNILNTPNRICPNTEYISYRYAKVFCNECTCVGSRYENRIRHLD